jgi:hypothetical protein
VCCWPILGHTGFLEFFDAQLLGGQQKAILVPNAAFTGIGGQHFVPPPLP